MNIQKPTNPSKVERLETLWSELLQKDPTADQLADIARLIPELRERAWAKFASTKPSEGQLIRMVRAREWDRTDIKQLPAQLLMDNLPSIGALRIIWEECELAVHERAAALTVTHPDAVEGDLITIMGDHRSASHQRAAEKLLKITKNHSVLQKIMRQVPQLSDKAAERLLGASPDQGDLTALICYSDAHAERAWDLLKAQSPTDSCLSVLVSCSGRFHAEAAEMLLTRKIPDAQAFSTLFAIFERLPDMRLQVIGKLAHIKLSEAQAIALKDRAPGLTPNIDSITEAPVRDASRVYHELLVANI